MGAVKVGRLGEGIVAIGLDLGDEAVLHVKGRKGDFQVFQLGGVHARFSTVGILYVY